MTLLVLQKPEFFSGLLCQDLLSSDLLYLWFYLKIQLLDTWDEN